MVFPWSSFRKKMHTVVSFRLAFQDAACRSAHMAAERAQLVAQAVDLVRLSGGPQPLRLHARWMEMVNRGNQLLGARKSMRLGEGARLSKAKQG